jgi:hypothetical protein
MRCKYLYLEATREMKLSKISSPQFGGKRPWMRCKYFYLEATRETKLPMMFVARKNLAGKDHVDKV